MAGCGCKSQATRNNTYKANVVTLKPIVLNNKVDNNDEEEGSREGEHAIYARCSARASNVLETLLRSNNLSVKEREIRIRTYQPNNATNDIRAAPSLINKSGCCSVCFTCFIFTLHARARLCALANFTHNACHTNLEFLVFFDDVSVDVIRNHRQASLFEERLSCSCN